MSEWLDDLVSKTKHHYEDQKSKETAFLEQQRLKKALGKVFFKDLKDGMKTNADRFNKKFGSEVFSVEDDLSADAFSIQSKPDSKLSWNATVTYAPEAHLIEINRSPGGPQTYRIDITPDGSGVVALYGNSTDRANGLGAELLVQNIMAMMLST